MIKRSKDQKIKRSKDQKIKRSKDQKSKNLWYLNLFVDPRGGSAEYFKGLLKGATDHA